MGDGKAARSELAFKAAAAAAAAVYYIAACGQVEKSSQLTWEVVCAVRRAHPVDVRRKSSCKYFIGG
jgi:hypothetical protein